MPQELVDKSVNRDNEETPEELTSTGIGAGLEAEPNADDRGAPFDPSKIDVTTQQRTVDLLMTRLQHNELNLSPDFQRRSNLWNEVRKSGLIESMLLRIPIPSLYVSEDKEGDYTVVDGLQRMCSIAHFLDVDVLNRAVGTKLSPLRLTRMQSLREFENYSFGDLPRPLQRRIVETELTLHVIRVGTPSNVKFNIFYRINQGGLPLNAQEIRNAIFHGEWRDYVRTLAQSAAFAEATEGRIKGERMEDLELVLRFVALYSLPRQEQRQTDENLDEFLNNFVEKRCARWPSDRWDTVEKAFERAMRFAPRVFGYIAFRKYSPQGVARRPINRGLFETESVALARRNESELEVLSSRSNQVVDKFRVQLESNQEFYNALLYATGRGGSSNKRLEVIEEIFDEVLSA